MPYRNLTDLRQRTGLSHDDLRTLIKVGACDSIANGMTRPMLLWELDRQSTVPAEDLLTVRPSDRPTALRAYSEERRRTIECELLGFTTSGHPMALHAEALRRFRITPATELHRHVGKRVLCAGLLTTAKPVTTVQDEPMEFVTFDDGTGLIETVLFPGIYQARAHVLFDQGPFVFRGTVEEEFGAVTVTVTDLERLERMVAKLAGLTTGNRKQEAGNR